MGDLPVIHAHYCDNIKKFSGEQWSEWPERRGVVFFQDLRAVAWESAKVTAKTKEWVVNGVNYRLLWVG